MTSVEFLKSLSGDVLAYAENLVSQRDDALARIAAHDAVAAGLQAQLADQAKLVALLGGTELGQQMAKEKRLTDAQEAKEAAVAALAAAEQAVIDAGR